MLKTRVLTALVLAICLLSAMFWLPESGWVLFCAVLMGAAAWEWCALAGLSNTLARGYPWMTAGLFVVLSWLHLPFNVLLGVLVGACLFWLVVAPIWLATKWCLRSAGDLNFLLGWALLLPAGLALLLLRRNAWLLLAVLMIAWVADSTAYFTGKALGRHKLAPSISPGKTWEGVGGAVLGVAMYLWLLPKSLISFSDSGVAASMLLQHVVWIACGVLLTAVCVVGDLLESLFKRQAGMKDSSHLLPGHGGILDRIDSLLALLPVAAAIYLTYLLFFSVSVAH
ncbi:MAG: phosphatidate cytidylyltransferase [Formivibrio sp.]|nr:phosphatidate cytidylyltransferase [Formivibrio sp.]